MANRLTKIVTRTGDKGTSGLGDGTRVSKDSLRMCVIGEIDELNSHLGVLLAEDLPQNARQTLTQISHELFDLGGEICIPNTQIITDAHVLHLENEATLYNENLGALKDFILPGGTKTAALCHLTRAVCRRVERSLVSLANAENVNEPARKYANRLSDLLFILGRYLNHHAGQKDVLWQSSKNRISLEDKND